MLIIRYRLCSFCGRKYEVTESENRLLGEMPGLVAVHDECAEKWMQLPPDVRLERYAKELRCTGELIDWMEKKEPPERHRA